MTDLSLEAVSHRYPTGALALYEQVGMRVVEQFTRWERPAAD